MTTPHTPKEYFVLLIFVLNVDDIADVGILKAFRLVVATKFDSWLMALYPNPVDGKTMDVISWEVGRTSKT